MAHWKCGGSVGMWWLSGDVVAQLRSLWLIGDEMAHWRCGGLLEVWWLSGDRGGSVDIVVAHWRCGRCSGSLKMWWLIGDGLVHWSCSGSLEMGWLSQSSSDCSSIGPSFEFSQSCGITKQFFNKKHLPDDYKK